LDFQYTHYAVKEAAIDLGCGPITIRPILGLQQQNIVCKYSVPAKIVSRCTGVQQVRLSTTVPEL